MKLESLVRKNILNLQPYSSARDKYQDGIFLDANENSFGSVVGFNNVELNRYPDPHQRRLRAALSNLLNLDESNLIFGVGSDQIIDLTVRIFCEPGKSNVIIPTPTYGVFKVACSINNIKVRECKLDDNFDIDVNSILELADADTRIIFLCTPNNPTGNLFNHKKIISLVKSFKGIIFIDEAYIEFAGVNSFINHLKEFNNVVISRTFSKAWGLAGVRCGYCAADEFIIKLMLKVKDPYSISWPTSELILVAIDKADSMRLFVSKILEEKRRMIEELKKIEYVIKIFPSDANFLLVRMKNALKIFEYLNQNKLRVRMRNDDDRLKDCLRITIGNDEQNNLLINLLKGIN